MSLLESGMSWLEEQRREHMTRTVTYRRGSLSVELPATAGEHSYPVVDVDGIMMRVSIRDYLISAADLVLGGRTVEPQEGDRVEETLGSDTIIYEVLSPGGGEDAWRWSDQYRNTLRVHTKQYGRQV